MARRLLLIESAGESLPATLVPIPLLGADVRYERIEWNEVLPATLDQRHADLIVPIVPKESVLALPFFKWIADHPIKTPMLALLPEEAEAELFLTATRAATDFVTWPVSHEDLARRATRILTRLDDLASVRDRLLNEMGLATLVGEDPKFLRIVAQILRVARSDSPVLITGETGTGKEHCARAIHHLGKRRDFPFIPVDCGAFPDHLFENEMFGHTRGAFTDAHRDQKGLVSLAEGGALFLDEIDSLSLSGQAKLLRFMQDQTYRPLGGERFIRANVKVLAATNRDVDQLVREQRLRNDLFFRLNVLRLEMVPLRERRGDIPILAQHFLDRLCAQPGTQRKTLAPASMTKLSRMDWPGNVRELSNVIQRAFVFAEGLQILPVHIAGQGAAEEPECEGETFRQARMRAIADFERQYVVTILRQHKGNITQAARTAGKDRRAFGRLVKRHNIDRRVY